MLPPAPLALFLLLLLVHTSAQAPSAMPSMSPATSMPSVKPTGPSQFPSYKPSITPTRALLFYQTTDAQAKANIAYASVLGTSAFIVWASITYYKLKEDFILSSRTRFIDLRARKVVSIPQADYSI